MGRKALTWAGGLIALYLIVAHAQGFGKATTSVDKAASGVAKTFQGR